MLDSLPGDGPGDVDRRVKVQRRKFQLVFGTGPAKISFMCDKRGCPVDFRGDDVVDDLRCPPLTQGEGVSRCRRNTLQAWMKASSIKGSAGMKWSGMRGFLADFRVKMVMHFVGMSQDVVGIVQEL